MWRGVRYIALVATVLVLAAGKPPSPNNKADEAEATQNAANTVAAAIREVRPDKDAGCEDRQDDRGSDLCAQWKAADANRDAARYTLLAVILSALGTGLVGWSLLVTVRTARWQLRPYVYLTSCSINPEKYSQHGQLVDRAPLIFFFKNFGQTPAKNATLRAQWSFGGHFNEPFSSDFSKATEVQLGDLPPGYIRDRDGYYVLDWEKMKATVVFGQVDTLFAEGIVKYSDANGRSYETVFRLGATGEDYQNQKWSVPPHGNRST